VKAIGDQLVSACVRPAADSSHLLSGTIQMGLTMDATDCCGRASARMRSASAF